MSYKLDWEKMRGLLPVVMENTATNETLTLAYANIEALKRTLDTGLATFYSRSRSELWTKGQSSGNIMEIEEIFYDCDYDALLYRVMPNGPACHEGPRTCFYRKLWR